MRGKQGVGTTHDWASKEQKQDRTGEGRTEGGRQPPSRRHPVRRAGRLPTEPQARQGFRRRPAAGARAAAGRCHGHSEQAPASLSGGRWRKQGPSWCRRWRCTCGSRCRRRVCRGWCRRRPRGPESRCTPRICWGRWGRCSERSRPCSPACRTCCRWRRSCTAGGGGVGGGCRGTVAVGGHGRRAAGAARAACRAIKLERGAGVPGVP